MGEAGFLDSFSKYVISVLKVNLDKISSLHRACFVLMYMVKVKVEINRVFLRLSPNASSVVTDFNGSGTSGDEPCQGKPAGEGDKEEGR